MRPDLAGRPGPRRQSWRWAISFCARTGTRALPRRRPAPARDWAFSVLRAPRVYSVIRDTNVASQRVAQRNGMAVADRFVKHYRGVEMPHLLYAVDNPAKN